MSILTNDKERIERFYHIGRQLDIIAEWADGVQVIAAEPNRVIVGDTYKLSAQLQILKAMQELHPVEKGKLSVLETEMNNYPLEKGLKKELQSVKTSVELAGRRVKAKLRELRDFEQLWNGINIESHVASVDKFIVETSPDLKWLMFASEKELNDAEAKLQKHLQSICAKEMEIKKLRDRVEALKKGLPAQTTFGDAISTDLPRMQKAFDKFKNATANRVKWTLADKRLLFDKLNEITAWIQTNSEPIDISITDIKKTTEEHKLKEKMLESYQKTELIFLEDNAFALRKTFLPPEYARLQSELDTLHSRLRDVADLHRHRNLYFGRIEQYLKLSDHLTQNIKSETALRAKNTLSSRQLRHQAALLSDCAVMFENLKAINGGLVELERTVKATAKDRNGCVVVWKDLMMTFLPKIEEIRNLIAAQYTENIPRISVTLHHSDADQAHEPSQ